LADRRGKMKLVGTFVLAILAAALVSCKSAPPQDAPGDRGKGAAQKPNGKEAAEKPDGEEKKAGQGEAKGYAMTRLPQLDDRRHFEETLKRLKTGSDQERRTVLVAFQLKMDLCLPLIIEHLEDREPFRGIDYLYVTRFGQKVAEFKIPDTGFNAGAALEMFLASYFYKDPARKNFNIANREGATSLWKKWYEQRKHTFKWARSGFYSTK
jgi:hypothetical protein